MKSLPTMFTSLTLGIALMTSGSAMAAPFTVTSADAKDGKIPLGNFANVMGCKGDNISPEVSWDGAPEGTKSFVVTMYDRDAQTGSGWWHWVVTNIPATATSLPRGAGNDASKLPAGAVQTNSDVGMPGYGGPCPPVGETHRYVITVKALRVEKLELPPNATGALVGMLSNKNSLAQATVILEGSR